MENTNKLRKILIIIVAILIVVTIITGLAYYLNKENEETTLTILEKQWIESNKENIIDIVIESNIPLFTSNDDGIFFDFLTDFEEDTNLSFNKIPSNEITSELSGYSFVNISDTTTITSEYVEVYHDNYVYISPKNETLNSLAEFSGLTIGLLAENAETVENYNINDNITYITYDSLEELQVDYALNFDDILSNKKIDGFILPYITNLDTILELKSSYVNYNFSDLYLTYALVLDGETSSAKLNSIITKYYNNWDSNNIESSYYSELFNEYKSVNNLEDLTIANYKSKRYVYGVVNNLPFESQIGDNIVGINREYIEGFSEFGSVEFEYKYYDDVASLLQGAAEGEIDVFFDYYNLSEELSVINTTSTYDSERIVLVTGINNVLAVDSLKSLVGENLYAVIDTKIHNYLTEEGSSIITFASYEEMLKNLDSSDIFVIDYDIYEYYKNTEFASYKAIYTEILPDEYGFAITNDEENVLFAEMFNYYLTVTDNKLIKSEGLKVVKTDTSNLNREYIIFTFILPGFVMLVLVILIYPRVKKLRKVKVKNTKDSKLRFIDKLTSLKNRDYLKENMAGWQETPVYPKSLVIVDLNKIQHINDSHGYEEGDKVIKEAASILINSQIANSDIIRIDGNEFLIYLVGYTEREIITYMKRLEKAMKALSYNHGAAIGYSIIKDSITTIEDGINEAYLDMKETKEHPEQ